MAAKFGIPLVFYGENEAEFGNPIADNNSALRDEHFFAVNDYDHIYLGGVSLRQLEEDYKIDKADLAIYLPGETSNLEKNHVQVRYLGYYEKWHPQGAYYYAVEHGGFRPAPERTQGTYSKYNSIDDKIDDFFYYTTYIKYGIGRATYDAAQEIRNGEITLDEGRALCKKFDGEYPDRFEKEIFKYLSIDKQHFPLGQPAVRGSPAWTGTTSCTWPTGSAARTCGSGRTICGSCATPPTRATARCFGATPRAPTTRCKAARYPQTAAGVPAHRPDRACFGPPAIGRTPKL